jgi:hypothetical protein
MALIASSVPLRSQQRATTHEQTHFSAEDEAVQQPVKIPDDAWKVLQNDEQLRNLLEGEGLSPERLPRSWFSASVLHLHNAHTRDLVVEGESALRGANVNTFWVFVQTANGLKLALMIAAHDLMIRPLRYGGYKTIEAASMNCCTVFTTRLGFDGKSYIEFSRASKGAAGVSGTKPPG